MNFHPHANLGDFGVTSTSIVSGIKTVQPINFVHPNQRNWLPTLQLFSFYTEFQENPQIIKTRFIQ